MSTEINAVFKNGSAASATLIANGVSETVSPGASASKTLARATAGDVQFFVRPTGSTTAGQLTTDVKNIGNEPVKLDMLHQDDVTLGVGDSKTLSSVVGPDGNTNGVGFRVTRG